MVKGEETEVVEVVEEYYEEKEEQEEQEEVVAEGMVPIEKRERLVRGTNDQVRAEIAPHEVLAPAGPKNKKQNKINKYRQRKYVEKKNRKKSTCENSQ